MRVTQTAETHDKVAIKEFCYRNEYGGTSSAVFGMKEDDPERYNGLAVVQVTEFWCDDETGLRYIAKPLNPELIEFLTKMKAIGRPLNGDDMGDEPRDSEHKVLKDSVGPVMIFFSEFDIDWGVTNYHCGFENYKN